MSYAALPFDPEAFLDAVKPWVACESPSWDIAAVNRMVSLAARDMAARGATVTAPPTAEGHAGCALATFHRADDAPGILIVCHLDTVHPEGCLDGDVPWRRDGDKAHGPGLFDMKSGAYLALEAIRLLAAAGIEPKLPVRVLMTGDEESGSRGARPVVEALARQERYVLVPEGAQPNGHLVSGRLPSTRLRVILHGKPAHALLQRDEGLSAVSAMAALIPQVEALSRPGSGVTVVVLEAGKGVGVVPVRCLAEILLTATDQPGLDAQVARVQQLAEALPGIGAEVTRKSHRPHWRTGPGDRAMADLARRLGLPLGLSLEFDSLAGGSDGNFTGHLGVPTLDQLGPVGADAHQFSEHILVSSIVPRGRLLAGLIAELD